MNSDQSKAKIYQPKFSKIEKILFIIILNVVIFLSILYGFLSICFTLESFQLLQFFTLILIFYCTLTIFMIGKIRNTPINIKLLLLIVFISRIIPLITVESFIRSFSAGDISAALTYAEHWLMHEDYLSPYGTPYYLPPGSTLLAVAVLAINPSKSTLMFRLFFNFFEVGNVYMVYKIYLIQKNKIPFTYFKNGIYYYPFALLVIPIHVIYGKYDAAVIFITLVGIYFYFRKKFIPSAMCMVFAGFAKLYSFAWLLGMIIFQLKRKNFSHLRKTITGLTLGTILIYIPVYYFEGFRFFSILLGRPMHFYDFNQLWTLNTWFFMVYLGIPGFKFWIYGTMGVCILYYFIFTLKKIDIYFFIRTTCIMLFFYPSSHVHYLIWILPLIYLDFFKSFRFVRILEALIFITYATEFIFNVVIIFFTPFKLIDLEILTFEHPPPVWTILYKTLNNLSFQIYLLLVIFKNKLPNWFFPKELPDEMMIVYLKESPKNAN
ncbi:MAG: hypothetical protein ACTSWN_16530 [Promethearchaeota archaeon]